MISRADRKALGLLALIVVVTTLPFLRRAYFVDDYYHMTMAQGILTNPWRPYDFKSDDAGIGNVAWEPGQPPRMVNPPLFHYSMALVMKVFGTDIWKLRAASLVFSFVSLFCLYFLSKRFVKDPLASTALLAITPAYWLTSYSLLIDAGLIAFFSATLLLFLKAHEERSLPLVLVSGLLMGLTILVKYTGVLILLLCFVWQVLDPQRRKWWSSYRAYSICLIVLAVWGLWNTMTYGAMHMFATLPRGVHGYSAGASVVLLLLVIGFCVKRGMYFAIAALAVMVAGLWKVPSIANWIQAFYIDKVFVLGSFLAGCTGFVFFAPWLLARQRSWAAAISAASCLLLFVMLRSDFGGFDFTQSLLMSVMVTATGAYFTLVRKRYVGSWDQKKVFLLVWLTAGTLELVTVMPWTAARYLLTLLPCMVWIFWDLTEDARWVRKAAGAFTAVLALALAYADYRQANVIVDLAARLKADTPKLQTLAPNPPRRWYYLADTFDGSQPYLLPLGWQNAFPYQEFPSGDLFLRSFYRKSSWWKMTGWERFEPVQVMEINTWMPLRVMDVPASAGFYASCWGALPFTITTHPLERFELYRVREPRARAAAAPAGWRLGMPTSSGRLASPIATHGNRSPSAGR